MLYLKSIKIAGVAELVDAHDSKSCIFGCAGSTPATGTKRLTVFTVNLLFFIKVLICSFANIFIICKCKYFRFSLTKSILKFAVEKYFKN